MTPAARRRLAVLRGLVGAVAASVVGWVVLDGWGLVLLAVSLLALAAYCALLASMSQQPARRDRRAPTGRGEAAVDAGPVERSA